MNLYRFVFFMLLEPLYSIKLYVFFKDYMFLGHCDKIRPCITTLNRKISRLMAIGPLDQSNTWGNVFLQRVSNRGRSNAEFGTLHFHPVKNILIDLDCGTPWPTGRWIRTIHLVRDPGATPLLLAPYAVGPVWLTVLCLQIWEASVVEEKSVWATGCCGTH